MGLFKKKIRNPYEKKKEGRHRTFKNIAIASLMVMFVAIGIVAVIATSQRSARLNTRVSFTAEDVAANVYLKVTHVKSRDGSTDVEIPRGNITNLSAIDNEDTDGAGYTGMIKLMPNSTAGPEVGIPKQDLVEAGAVLNLPDGASTWATYVRYDIKVVNNSSKNIGVRFDLNLMVASTPLGRKDNNLVLDYMAYDNNGEQSKDIENGVDILSAENVSDKRGTSTRVAEFTVWVNVDNPALNVSDTDIDINITLTSENENNAYDGVLVKKGEIIQMDTNSDGTSERYKVIGVDGDDVKLLAMDNLNNTTYNWYDEDEWEYEGFPGMTYVKYIGSAVDTALTAWYDSRTIKSAIKSTEITRHAYQLGPSEPIDYDYTFQYNWGNNKRYLTDSATANASISRYVYEIGVEEIYAYFGKTDISSNELNMLFWDTSSSVSDSIWLNSPQYLHDVEIITVYGGNGCYSHKDSTESYSSVRPTFVVDLSQVTYSIERGVSKGEILNIDADGDGNTERYKVLSVNGDDVKLMAMYNLSDAVVYYSSSATTTFYKDGASVGNYQTYEGSNLDNYLDQNLNSWYNRCAIKDAIQSTKVEQCAYRVSDSSLANSIYTWDNDTNNDSWLRYDGTATPVNRHVYSLGIEDIAEYLDITAITYGDVLDFLWDSWSTNKSNTWLSSAITISNKYVIYVEDDGELVNPARMQLFPEKYQKDVHARPVFVVDITKVDYTIGITGIIAMDSDGDGTNERYRVLNLDGTNAKVVAMEDMNNTRYEYGSNDNAVAFSKDGVTVGNYRSYAGSNIDNLLDQTALTSWYNSRESTFKNAIQSTVITQHCYGSASEDYTYTYQTNWSGTSHLVDVGTASTITRHVFALGIEDIYEYFGSDSITSSELNELFWERSYAMVGKDIWLNSVSPTGDSALKALEIYGDYGKFAVYETNSTHNYLRPAFVIDLSQVSYEVERVKLGEIISIDSDDDGTAENYRVIKVSGNDVKLLAMTDYTQAAYNATTSHTTTFSNNSIGQQYSGSNVDNVLEQNTDSWYNTRESNFKNAIKNTTVIQHKYSFAYSEPADPYTYKTQYDNSTYHYATDLATNNVGNRHVYILGVGEIFEYLGNKSISTNEVKTLFWNTTGSVSGAIWLNSATNSSSYVWTVRGAYGDLYGDMDTEVGYASGRVRPTFTVDISLVNFSRA